LPVQGIHTRLVACCSVALAPTLLLLVASCMVALPRAMGDTCSKRAPQQSQQQQGIEPPVVTLMQTMADRDGSESIDREEFRKRLANRGTGPTPTVPSTGRTPTGTAF